MSDSSGPADDEKASFPEDLGSVSDEAAKLFGALSDWARDSAAPGAGLADSLSGLVDQAAATVSEIDAHLATGSGECTYCPICRTVHAVRQTSPEVKAHLAGAASSFLQAVVGLLATLPPPAARPESGAGVERIDLDDPDDPDGEGPP